MRKLMNYLPVRELRIIRITCLHSGCGMVFELSPSKIVEAMKKTNGCCPLCGKPFMKTVVNGGGDVILQLAQAIINMDLLNEQVLVELPITEE